jgi:hypothetical protein
VENSDIGMKVFGVFLYIASPSLRLCLIGFHHNNNCPAAYKKGSILSSRGFPVNGLTGWFDMLTSGI